MESLLFVLIAVVEIIAIVDVLRAALPGAKKILWILLILFVPVIGIVFYYLLGRPDNQAQQPNKLSN